MTAGELIVLLEGFSPDLPVYFCPDGRVVVSPVDADVSPVHSTLRQVFAYDGTGQTVPDGFTPAIVVFQRRITRPPSSPALR